MSLSISVFLLGLAAVDPIGIGAMPLLLSQKHPYIRSTIFLLGSFIALMLAGIMLSLGLGSLLLHIEQTYTWILPAIELGAGLILIGIGVYMLRQVGRQGISSNTSTYVTRRLQLGNMALFFIGAALVLVQSIVDVVFVVAMIKIGALHLLLGPLVLVVGTYAVAALLLQLAVVVAYRLTPTRQRTKVLVTIRTIVTKYADKLAIIASFILGGILMLNGILSWMGYGLF